MENELPTEAEVRAVKDLTIVLQGHYNEISILSKKNPLASVSEIKIALIDKALEPARDALSRIVPLDQLPLLADIDPPHTSDAAFVLQSYLSAASGFYQRYFVHVHGGYAKEWLTQENAEDHEEEDDL